MLSNCKTGAWVWSAYIRCKPTKMEPKASLRFCLLILEVKGCRVRKLLLSLSQFMIARNAGK